MKIVVSLATLALGCTLVLPQPASAAATACTWRATPLPVPAGGDIISVDGTDHSGGWAGTAWFSESRWHAIAWKNGTITDYGPVVTTSTAFATVVDENRAGTIVGNTKDGLFPQIKTAFRIRAGRLERLPVLPGASTTQVTAAAINDAGDIIGTNLVSRNGGGGTVVVRWPGDRPTAVEEVPGLPLGTEAIDLDEDGSMLVGLRNGGDHFPAVLRAGVLTPLPPLRQGQTVQGRRMSNGRVTGSVSGKSGPATGVVWERNLTPHALPNAIEGIFINRDGLVVGAPTGNSWGVWRNGTLEFAFGTPDDLIYIGALGDDGAFAGDFNGPTVWRCA